MTKEETTKPSAEQPLWEKYRFEILFLLAGSALIGLGALLFKTSINPQPLVVEKAQTPEKTTRISVEIAGAVNSPGVYEATFGSRLIDLLNFAAGLSVLADKDWVARNLNLAKILADGEKIYIPKKGEEKTNVSNSANSPNLSNLSNLINLNTASSAELDGLPGIGPERAGKIINGRPYGRIEELLEKKIVSAKVFENIKDKIKVF